MASGNENSATRWTLFALLASLGALLTWFLVSKRRDEAGQDSDGLEGLFRVCDRALNSLDRDESAA